MQNLTNKILINIILFLLVLPIVFSEDLLKVDFSVSTNDDVIINDISIIDGDIFIENYESEYMIRFLDSSKQTYLAVPKRIYVPSPNHAAVYFDTYDASAADKLWNKFSVKVLFDDRFDSVVIEKNSISLAEESIKQSLCNNNQVCESYENFKYCPADCLSGSRDNYCDNINDGICDPDCKLLDVDDCFGKELDKKVLKKKSSSSITKSIPYSILASLIIILVLIGLILYKRRINITKDPMVDSKVKKFIEFNKKHNLTTEEIKKKLRDAKVSEETINKFIK